MPLLLLTSVEAEAAELESQISETELQLGKLQTQNERRSVKKIQGFQQSFPESHKVPKSTATTQTLPHQPKPTVQKKPVTYSAYEDQFFKLVSPPRPTIHLHTTKSTLTPQSQSPLNMQMDIGTLQLLQEQTSKQIQELQGLINMQLELQQLLVQQLATFRQPAAVDQSSRRSKSDNAMPRVPPGFKPLNKEFENLEKPIPIAKNIDRQEKLAQTPKFCQVFLNKEAGKHFCLANNPKILQQTLNPVKNHQCISQTVDGQKTKSVKQKIYIIETRSAWKK